MGGNLDRKLAFLFRVFLYLSISAMIAGKIIHRFQSRVGDVTVNAGVYLIILCPLIGLLTVMFDSYRSGKRKLFLLSLAVSSLILLIMTVFLAAGRT